MGRRQWLESWLMTGRVRWRRWPRPCNEMQLFFLAAWLRHVLHTSRQTLKMRQHFGQLAAWTDCLSAHAHLLTHTHSLTLTHICTYTHTHVACGRSERVGQLRPRAIAPSLSSPFRCQLSLMYPARSGHASCLWPASASSSSCRAKCFALRLIDLIWRQACAGAVSKNPKIDMLPRQKLKVEGQKEKDEQKLKIREILTLTFALLTARAAQWACPRYCTFIKEKDAKSFLETPNKGYLYGFAEILIKNFRKNLKNLNWIKQARRIVRYQALMS